MLKVCLLFLASLFLVSCETINNRNTNDVRVMSHNNIGIHKDDEGMATAIFNNIQRGNYRTSLVSEDPWAGENETSLRALLVSQTMEYLHSNLFFSVNHDIGRIFRVNILKGSQRYIVFLRINSLRTVPDIYPLGVIARYTNLVLEVR